MTTDPLSELLLDATEVDKARLAKTLKDLLGVDSKTGLVVLKPGFSKLAARQKIIAYLLGRKASSLLGLGVAETVAAKEIPDQTGLPEGTVRPRLRELLDARYISQSEKSEYYIAQHQINMAIQQIEREEKDA